MSSINERRQRLILDLISGRVPSDEFARAFSVRPDELCGLGLKLLDEAYDEESPDGVEFGLYLGYYFGFSGAYFDVLSRLAVVDWHRRHEDVVSALDMFRNPKAIDALFRSALMQHSYLEYDETFALGRKAIWALHKIGTPEAVEAIGKLLHSDNPVIKDRAAEHLVSIEREDPSETVRNAAKQALAASQAQHRR